MATTVKFDFNISAPRKIGLRDLKVGDKFVFTGEAVDPAGKKVMSPLGAGHSFAFNETVFMAVFDQHGGPPGFTNLVSGGSWGPAVFLNNEVRKVDVTLIVTGFSE